MKVYKSPYYVGMSLSLLVGLWHFTVPTLFQWGSYIPAEYSNLMVGIDWINACFSLLLSGLSVLLLCWGKRLFAGNREALTLYGFMTAVWLFRVGIAIVEPWPLQPVPAASYGQLGGSVLIAVLLLVPFLKLLLPLLKQKKSNR